jgi:hypothetical protein
MSGIVIKYLKDAKTGLDFPVQFFDDGSGNLIADVPASTVWVLSVGVTAQPGRQIKITCTAPGNVVLKLSGGSTTVVPINVGVTLLPWQVVQVVTSGTTATATYENIA